MPFKHSPALNLLGIKSTIIVTAEMKKAYEFVTNPDRKGHNILCMLGGPGCGKTTTLFWLLKQLEISDKYKPVTGVLGSEVVEFSIETKDFLPNHVLLIDLNEAKNATVKMIKPVLSLLHRFHRVVFAVSSGFIAKLESDQSTKNLFSYIFRCASRIRCKQFTDAETQTFAKELRSDISAEEVQQLIVATKGVPRLLCYAYVDSGMRAWVIQDAIKTEFTNAIKALPINSATPTDVKILLACYFKISLRSVNLTLVQTKESVLLKANLVYIETEDLATVPHCYFQIDQTLIELLGPNLCVPFHNRFGTVSTRAGLGDVFEGAFPTILSQRMDLCVSPVHSIEERQTISLTFKNTDPLLYDRNPTNIHKGFLYETPMGCIGIDFLSLQDKPIANTLVGIQVTIQNKNIEDKVEKTLRLFPLELEKHFETILLIIVNPNWVDGQCFDLVHTYTSSGRVQQRYGKWYYGELCDFDPLLALLHLMLTIHQMP